MKILNIQSSAGMERSLTRQLSRYFLDRLTQNHPLVEIEELDLIKNPPAFITPEWIAAAFSKEEPGDRERMILASSDKYISQVEAADYIVIGTPMYNYGMPAVLKAWFDQVARINKTFSFDLSRGDFPIEPILTNKKLFLFTACGEFGFEKDGVRAQHEHLVAHIKSCAHYLGVDIKHDFNHIGIEYQEFKDERHTQSKNEAFARIDKVTAALGRV